MKPLHIKDFRSWQLSKRWGYGYVVARQRLIDGEIDVWTKDGWRESWEAREEKIFYFSQITYACGFIASLEQNDYLNIDKELQRVMIINVKSDGDE